MSKAPPIAVFNSPFELGLRMVYPHLGVVVVDSPLKAYADPTLTDSNEVAVSTVTDNFYAWLAKWEGPGQVVILENEEIRDRTAKVLKPIEFTGTRGSGRAGFYPERVTGDLANADSTPDSQTPPPIGD